MARYRKLPVEIEAEQWTDPLNPPPGVTGVHSVGLDTYAGYVETVGGPARIWLHDYVVPEAEPDRYYPIRPDVFARTYEPIEET